MSMDVNGSAWIAQAYAWACERLYDEMAWSYDAVSWLVSAGRWSSWRAGAWAWVVDEPILELGVGTGVLLADGLRLRRGAWSTCPAIPRRWPAT